MKLTVEQIRALNPCIYRFDNFLIHYPNFNGTIEDFVMLENITYEDKIWVLVRLMSNEQKRVFALKCALSVLNIFEQKYPNDDRPRKALEAVEAYLSNPTKESAAAAAYAAADVYAAYAACAADYVARAAAAVYTAADAAAYAADAAADAARVAQKDLNLIFAVEALKGE